MTHRNGRYIVTLHAADTKQAAKSSFTEFWLLMELCPGGHVVDLMNTRIGNPFTEAEALKIFEDSCFGMKVTNSPHPLRFWLTRGH